MRTQISKQFLLRQARQSLRTTRLNLKRGRPVAALGSLSTTFYFLLMLDDPGRR